MPASGHVEAQYAYMRDLVSGVMGVDPDTMGRIGDLLGQCRREGRTGYTCGNGGSAANASHMALHLNQAGLKAVCLSDNVPMLTAEANDVSYDRVFSEQARWFDMTKSVLIVISGSGNSTNILRIIDAWCGEIIALLGMGGGEAVERLHGRPGSIALVVPSMAYGPIEDAHSAIIHILAERLKIMS